MADSIFALVALLTALCGAFAILALGEKLTYWLQDRRNVLPPPVRGANRDWFVECHGVRRGRA